MSAFALTAVSRLFAAAVVIATGAVVGHAFGPEARGAFGVLVGLRLGLHALAGLGLGSAATYFVAQDPRLAVPVGKRAVGVGLALGAAAGGLLLFGVVAFPAWLAPLDVPWAAVFLASAPAVLATHLVSGVLLGAGLVARWNLLTVLNRGVLLAGIATVLFGPLRSFETVVATMAGAEWLTFLLALSSVPRGPKGDPSLAPPLLRSMVRYGSAAWLQGALAFGLLRSDTLMLAALAGTEQAGLHEAAGLMRDAVLFLPWIAGLLWMPAVAAARAARRRAPRPLPLVGILWTLFVATTLSLGAETFLRITHGPAFTPAVPLVRLLVPAALVASVGHLSVQFLLGVGAPRAAIAPQALALAVSLAGNALLAPAHGAVGTAWAAVASAVAGTLLALPLALRHARRGLPPAPV